MLGEYLGAESQADAEAGKKTPFRAPNRQDGRVPISARMTVRPANSSQRQTMQIDGKCRDISPKGIGTLLELPPTVGDFYWVEIESQELQFQTGICRCIRCQFVREDGYEAGFEFLTETSPRFVQTPEPTEDLI